MSTIKVNNIVPPNVGEGVSIDGLQMPTAGALSNRSLIINGAMQVAQRGTNQASVSNGSNEGFNTIDRFGIEFANSAGGVCTISQDSTVPSGYGFSSSYKVDVTTADTSIADGHLIYIRQGIEAQNVRNCGWDYTDTSSFITISFWARSSKAGNYCCTLRALDAGHFYYNHTYALVADTWKKVEFSVPGNASLVLNNDNGLGIDLRWNLAIAANRNDATTDSWQSGSEFSSTEIVNFFDSTSNDFYLTGVQLEVGSKATPFEHRSYGDELAKCQRYYEVHGAQLDTAQNGSGTAYGTWYFKQTKRDTPSTASDAGGIKTGTNVLSSTGWQIYQSAGALRMTVNAFVSSEL